MEFVDMRNRVMPTTELSSIVACFWGLLLIVGIAAGAEPIRPVADLSQIPIEGSSQPGGFLAAETGAYFTAFQTHRGRELWWTDGTAQGTRLVADLCPGSCSSSPTPLAARGDELFFTYDGDLWLTDGTDSGTRAVIEICPDCAYSYSSNGVVLGERVVFLTHYPGNNEIALLASDGTTEGTGPISSTSFGPSFPFSVFRAGDVGLFFSNDSDGGTSLWRTDGTAEGTAVIKEICADCYSNPQFSASLGDRLIFSANTRETGYEPWVTDGTTEGTFLLADLIPGEMGSTPSYPARLGDLIYGTLANCSGACVFVTDGTAQGTRFAPELYPAMGNGTVVQTAAAGSTLYVRLQENYEDELWALGGPGGQAFIAGGDILRVSGQAGGSLLFQVFEDGDLDWSFWTTSGTGETTRNLGDLYSNSNLAQIGDRAVFSGRVLDTQRNVFLSELWLTDGSSATELMDISPPFASSSPTDLLAWGDDVVLFSSDLRGYWRVNEQSAEVLIPDTYRTLSEVIGDQLFIYNWEVRGFEIFDRDGQSRVEEVPNFPPILMDHQGTAYFTQGPSQQGLWAMRDDGPELIADINPNWSYACPILCPPPYPEFPDQLTSFGEMLVFTAFEDEDGPAQLWRSDGTAEGTVAIREFDLGPSRSPAWDSPKNLTRAGERIFFTAFDLAFGNELWSTDGSGEGTRLIADLTPGEGSSSLKLLTAWGDGVALVQQTDDGDRLWRASATEATLISDLPTGAEVHEMVSSGHQLFASITVPAVGRDLWVSYGTPERTYALDLRPDDLRGSGAAGLMPIPGGVFFGADGTQESGFEPWVSDGSASGTRMIDDVFPGPAPSSPGPPVLIDETLYFAADNGQIDRELFVLDLADIGPLGCPEDRLCLGRDRFEVTMTWHTSSGATGEAKRVAADDESGLMWFFEPDNWEAMVKVLDGCSINDHFWVFAATSTNVGYTLSVEDVQTGTVKTYVNAVGENAPAITDTQALSVCP